MMDSVGRHEEVKASEAGDTRKATENEKRAAMGANLRRPFSNSVMLKSHSRRHNSTGRIDSAAQIYVSHDATRGMRHD